MTESVTNGYTPLKNTDTSSETLEVSNGDIVDSQGNPVFIGEQPTGPESVHGDEDEGVDRVKGASPTGDLYVDGDGNSINVTGHGEVTLTNATSDREVTSVGNNNGKTKQLEVDSGGDLFITWLEAVDYSEKKDSVEVSHEINKSLPSGAYDIESEAEIDLDGTFDSDLVHYFDTDGDGSDEYNESEIDNILFNTFSVGTEGADNDVSTGSQTNTAPSDADEDIDVNKIELRWTVNKERTPSVTLF